MTYQSLRPFNFFVNNDIQMDKSQQLKKTKQKSVVKTKLFVIL